LIPIFGAFVGCFLGAILVFMTDPMKVVVFLILFIVLQQIEGNLIYPHVVGNSVGLPPIWVLVAVTLGGNLMGITGMLIFIPLTSIIYALFREIIYLLLKKKQINPKEML
jgi:predicted PurR-regulated permease PerM